MTYPRWAEYMEEGRKAIDAREFRGAASLYGAAADRARDLPGARDTLLPASLANLAVSCRLAGQAQPALLEEALKCSVDRDTRLHLLNAWACTLMTRGDAASARRIFQAALAECEGHVDELSTALLANLARLHGSQGRYIQAESLYKRARGLADRVLGPRHPGTARIVLGMGLLYLDQGRYARAESLMRECLDLLEGRLPPDHLDMAAPYLALARLYTQQARQARAMGTVSENATLAEPLYAHVLAILKRSLGEGHPEYLVTLRAYALHLQYEDQLERSEELLMAILQRGLETFGPYHPEVANSLEQGAALLRQFKRTEMAAQMEAEAREIRALLKQSD